MKNKVMKAIACLTVGISLTFIACHKDNNNTPTTTTSTTPTNSDNYSSTGDFFQKNGVQAQTFSINASIGGTFTTSQGTKVTIPANSFYDASYHLITGTVTINFKDIYKKSDMLLSYAPTAALHETPLKSGGEFFFQPKAGSVQIAPILGAIITVQQPLNGLPVDSAMRPWFINPLDSLGQWIRNDSAGWVAPRYDSISGLDNYVFSLYQFSNPADSGTWCNSDNSTYFSSYPLTTLTLSETDNPSNYGTFVFLVFKNVNCMVHVYNGTGYTFPYGYAPEGLQCTMVAVGINSSGKVYSSFAPITIGSNMTVSFSMSETTTADFKSQLSELN